MEFILFLADTLALFILVYTSLRNDVKRPGDALIGPFRYDADVEPGGPRDQPRNARNRSGRF